MKTGRELPWGARIADYMRNGMGSWTFITVFCVGLAVWMLLRGPGGIDPFPFILLNLILSCVAALQGAIILIAQKRSDQVAAEEAHHTLDNTELLKQLLVKNTELTREIHEYLHDSTKQRGLG